MILPIIVNCLELLGHCKSWEVHRRVRIWLLVKVNRWLSLLLLLAFSFSINVDDCNLSLGFCLFCYQVIMRFFGCRYRLTFKFLTIWYLTSGFEISDTSLNADRAQAQKSNAADDKPNQGSNSDNNDLARIKLIIPNVVWLSGSGYWRWLSESNIFCAISFGGILSRVTTRIEINNAQFRLWNIPYSPKA